MDRPSRRSTSRRSRRSSLPSDSHSSSGRSSSTYSTMRTSMLLTSGATGSSRFRTPVTSTVPTPAQLEKLLPQAPQSFEVHELLGLVYAAQSQDSKALEHLDIAVRLKPDSAAARTNLAANLSHAGKLDLAAKQFQKALALDPRNFDANHNFGE